MVKNLLKIRVWSLGQDSWPGLGRSSGEGSDTHSGILAWIIPWTKEPGELQSMGLQRVGHKWSLKNSPGLTIENYCLKKYSPANHTRDKLNQNHCGWGLGNSIFFFSNKNLLRIPEVVVIASEPRGRSQHRSKSLRNHTVPTPPANTGRKIIAPEVVSLCSSEGLRGAMQRDHLMIAGWGWGGVGPKVTPQTPGHKQIHFLPGGRVLGHQAHFLPLMRLSLLRVKLASCRLSMRLSAVR